MTFGENVRKTREQQGMSQADLSRQAGVTQAMMSQIERGSKIPSLVTAQEIAKRLGVSLDALTK